MSGRMGVVNIAVTLFHADHIKPWAVTHTTNLFDMAALCPKCNNTKSKDG